MNEYSWIWQLSAGSALIFFFFLLLRFLIRDLRETLHAVTSTLADMEKAMVSRDQIILNHLEHFVEDEKELVRQLQVLDQNQDKQTEILEKLCRAWEINGGGK